MKYGVRIIYTVRDNLDYVGIVKTVRGYEKWIATSGYSSDYPSLPAKTFTDLNEAFSWKERKRGDGYNWYHLIEEYKE